MSWKDFKCEHGEIAQGAAAIDMAKVVGTMYDAGVGIDCEPETFVGACACIARLAFEQCIVPEYRLAMFDEAMAFHREKLKASLG